MAFFTLVYGSLSDRLGRRRMLLAGILLFSAGGALSAMADTIWLLIGGRLIQAAGGACGLVLARAIARDVYGTDRLVKAIAYLTMAYTMGPLLAPPIGGWLVDISGWRSVLVFAAAAGLAIAALDTFAIFETHDAEKGASAPASYMADYIRLFRDARFTAFVVQSGACSGAFYSTATASAFLMTEYLGRSATEYGFYFIFYPAGYWIGNMTAGRLSGRVAIETMVLAGSVLLSLTAVGLAVIILGGYVTPLSLFIPGFIITISQGIGLANAQAGAIRVSGELAGTAAGVGVFFQLFGAGLFSQLFGILSDGTPVPLAITVATAAALALAAGVVPFVLARAGNAV
jgi:DHA1 family bicyclomycin/chloramphenicol resistance-like MFS transporter